MSEPKQPEFDELVPAVLDGPAEYVTDESVLYEVVEREDGCVRVRDVRWPHWKRTLAACRVREVIPEPDFDSLR